MEFVIWTCYSCLLICIDCTWGAMHQNGTPSALLVITYICTCRLVHTYINMTARETFYTYTCCVLQTVQVQRYKSGFPLKCVQADNRKCRKIMYVCMYVFYLFILNHWGEIIQLCKNYYCINCNNFNNFMNN